MDFFLKHWISWVPYFRTNPSQPRVGCGNLTPETHGDPWIWSFRGYMDFGELNFADFAAFLVVVLKVVDLGVWLGMTFLGRENA